MSNIYSTRPVSNGREATTRRTIVVDQSFVMRPLLKGQSIGEDAGTRLFQQVHRGDYIITTHRDEKFPWPIIKVSRHNEDNPICGTFATEVLNNIHPLLSQYLLKYDVAKTNSM